ncbi:MAG: ribose 5-phosphate isomerase B [Deltaproteobacteria bacterium]|nr:ribose 5-phosphate isomerase B [Deltaproteobacteria bacterium]
MRVVVASDHAGFALKAAIVAALQAKGEAVEDLGCDSEASVDYPVFAARVAERVARGEAERGVLVCGSGIGMSIAANRFRGVRAALCGDGKAAELSRRHNDANVLCLGGRVTAPAVAESIVGVFLATPFEGGRHERRLKLIDDIE